MKNNQFAVMFLVALLVISSVSMISTPVLESGTSESMAQVFSHSYVEHGSFILLNETALGDQGFPGNGLEGTPYRISGFNITTDDQGIVIQNTSSYVIIEDCYFSAVTDPTGYGLSLINASHVTVVNCTFDSKLMGISTNTCNDLLLDNLTIVDTEWGIYDRYGNGTIINDVEITNSTYPVYIRDSFGDEFRFCEIENASYAIYTRDSVGLQIYNNTVTEAAYGLYMTTTEDSHIFNNTFFEDSSGLRIDTSLNITFSENTLYSTGLRITGTDYVVEQWNHTVVDNVVNGKELGYFWRQDMLSIDGNNYGQIIVANCRVTDVNGGYFHDVPYGVYYVYSDAGNITNVATEGCLIGINILFSNYVNVIDSSAIDCWTAGVRYEITDYGYLYNVTAKGTAIDGISLYSCDQISIFNSFSIENVQFGLTLDSSPGYSVSDNIWIFNNTIGWNALRNANDMGYNIWNSSTGNAWSDWSGTGFYQIGFSMSYDYTPRHALYLDAMPDRSISNSSTGNHIIWDMESSIPNSYELWFEDSNIESDLWNGSSLSFSIPDSLDVGSYNFTIFANTTTGHFVNDTVIVNVFHDTSPPTISSPSSVTMDYGDTGLEIQWIANDINPDTFIIIDNSTVLQSGDWESGVAIVQSLNGFSIGFHNITIMVFDAAGYHVNDTVNVTVLQSGYIPHASIYISSNSQLVSMADSEGWIGDGTEGSPFVIQWYEIPSISIVDVSLHFVIQDCYIHPSSGRGNQGIFFRNVGNGTIEDCGIHTMWVGVMLENSITCTIDNVTAFDCTLYGLELWSSSLITVTDCSFDECGVFIDGYSSEEWHHYMEWDTHHNYVNGKKLGYFYGDTDTVIQGSEWGQIILADCYRVEVVNVDISYTSAGILVGMSRECEISASTISDCEYGIFLMISNLTVVELNDITNCKTGIHLNFTYDTTLMNNTISGSIYAGIQGLGSYNDVSIGNVLSDCDIAISIWDGQGVSIHHNTIEGNHDGIDLNYCQYGSISNNVVWNNTGVGMTISYGCYNLTLYSNTIGPNGGGNAVDDSDGCYWNTSTGIGNTWSDYSGTGVYTIPGSGGGIDFHPAGGSELDSSPPTITNSDPLIVFEGSETIYLLWEIFDESNGNYTVYKNGTELFDGAWTATTATLNISTSFDTYPPGVYNLTIVAEDFYGNVAAGAVLVTIIDLTSPAVSTPNDASYIVGTTGNRIEWTLRDMHLDHYVIQMNGTTVGSGDWISASTLVLVSYSVDGLTAGVYNFSIIVYDESGNVGYDEVMIYITDDSTTPTTPTTPTTNATDFLTPEMMQLISMIVTLCGFGIVIIFVVLIFRSKK